MIYRGPLVKKVELPFWRGVAGFVYLSENGKKLGLANAACSLMNVVELGRGRAVHGEETSRGSPELVLTAKKRL